MNPSIRLERGRSPLRGALIALALAVAFSLLFDTCNTPLGPAIGSDNAMYLTMGTALSQGYAPYRDIFDHKGPLLFLLQMVPQLLAGGYSTLAVFVQEVLFLWACLLVLTHMARRLGVPAVLVQLIYLAVYAPLTDGGNLTEEYANLFTLVGLDVMLAVFGEGLSEEKEKRLTAPALCMGAMAALCFMTRANNALVLVGAAGALALYLMASRRWAGLGRCVLGFLAGCALVTAPIALWLVSQGVLSDAVYGSLLHNMMYAGTQGRSRVHMLLFDGYGHKAILLAALSCLGAACSAARTRKAPLALAMVAGAACGGLAGFLSHKFYCHYLMLSAPMAALGAAQALAFLRERGTRRLVSCAAVAASVLALAVSGVRINAQREADAAVMQTFAPDAQALYALVPEEERDSFMAYRVEPKWYVAARALPCMRFYFLQEILADADPAVMDEIVAEFENDPPKWLVLFYDRPFSPPYDARVAEIFDTRYEFVDARGEYQLKKLREAP